MTGVTRDTSGDAMREALAALATPTAPRLEPTPEALRRLWAQREAIKSLAEEALRVGKFHAELLRVPFNEREMARSVQRRCITLLAHLDDIERLGSGARAQTASNTNSGGGG